MKNKIFILLDRSGSMASMWKEALGGINSYVKNIKNADVMLASFDTLGYDVVRNTSTSEWKDISEEEIVPRAGTPLLDSAGRIMWSMLDSKSEKAILVIVTDGEENSSTKFNSSEIKAMTKKLTEQYDYEVVFLGANFDKIETVAKNNFGWNDMSRTIQTSVRGFAPAMNATAAATQDYFESGKADVFYSNEVKTSAKLK